VVGRRFDGTSHGDIVLTIPSKWQKMFNSSKVEVEERMSEPVDPEIIEELYDRVPSTELTGPAGRRALNAQRV